MSEPRPTAAKRILHAERDGAEAAYESMKRERDALLDALHAIRQIVGAGSLINTSQIVAAVKAMRERLDEAERRAGTKLPGT